MPIHTSTEYGPTIKLARDYDGEIMLFVKTANGWASVEIHASNEQLIEGAILDDDPVELEEICDDTIRSFLVDIRECFPGERFSHFADAPDDNSIIVTRQRTAQEISEARECIAYRDLLEAGLNEKQIQQLIEA